MNIHFSQQKKGKKLGQQITKLFADKMQIVNDWLYELFISLFTFHKYSTHIRNIQFFVVIRGTNNGNTTSNNCTSKIIYVQFYSDASSYIFTFVVKNWRKHTTLSFAFWKFLLFIFLVVFLFLFLLLIWQNFQLYSWILICLCAICVCRYMEVEVPIIENRKQ